MNLLLTIACINCGDVLLLFIGALLSAAITIGFVLLFKPSMAIETPRLIKDGKVLLILVRNIHKYCAAVNIQVEVAFVRNVDDNDIRTEHLKLDNDGFIMLPKPEILNDNNAVRGFKARNADDIAKIVEPEWKRLRVRVYALHSFTGFGKYFEAYFEYDQNKYCPAKA